MPASQRLSYRWSTTVPIADCGHLWMLCGIQNSYRLKIIKFIDQSIKVLCSQTIIWFSVEPSRNASLVPQQVWIAFDFLHKQYHVTYILQTRNWQLARRTIENTACWSCFAKSFWKYILTWLRNDDDYRYHIEELRSLTNCLHQSSSELGWNTVL